VRAKVIILNLTVETSIGYALLINGKGRDELSFEVLPDVGEGGDAPDVHTILPSSA